MYTHITIIYMCVYIYIYIYTLHTIIVSSYIIHCYAMLYSHVAIIARLGRPREGRPSSANSASAVCLVSLYH